MGGEYPLPSANALAIACTQKYKAEFGTDLPPEAGTSLESISAYFFNEGRLQSHFLAKVVPWKLLSAPQPNEAHVAIADFVLCDTVCSAITTNFDTLIELAAAKLGNSDLRAEVDAVYLNLVHGQSPYLKLHGCKNKELWTTVWCVEQLDSPPIDQRIENAKTWIQANLQTRDLIFVGYWSDWDYLNTVLQKCLGQIEPTTIIAVDPSETHALMAKAPGLAALVAGQEARFTHIRETADDFFNQLRLEYGHRFMRAVVGKGLAEYNDVTGDSLATPPAIGWPANNQAVYDLRRLATGTLPNMAVTEATATSVSNQVGAAYILAAAKGAEFVGDEFKDGNRRIVIIEGQGNRLSKVRGQYGGAGLALTEADVVICAGSTPDGGVPANILDTKKEGTIVRPKASGTWLTLQEGASAPAWCWFVRERKPARLTSRSTTHPWMPGLPIPTRMI